MEKKKSILLEMNIDDGKFYFPSTISSALIDASDELKILNERIQETTETLRHLSNFSL